MELLQEEKMKNIEIVGTGRYLPSRKIENWQLEQEEKLPKDYIYSRCGILTRYYVQEETIVEMAVRAAFDVIQKKKIDSSNIEMILVASTSSKEQMPGISFQVQKALQIPSCICLDVSAGCSGYINALDIARLYVSAGIATNALIIGVDVLSTITKEPATKILLADGAGATLIQATNEPKEYASLLESNGIEGDILTYQVGNYIQMNGKEIYRYAVTKTTKNIEELLEKTQKTIQDIDYFIPHQSNQKILDSMVKRLQIEKKKMISNIQNVGNTFCASIPIALDEVFDQIRPGQRILLSGYGGGLNTGSILLEK